MDAPVSNPKWLTLLKGALQWGLLAIALTGAALVAINAWVYWIGSRSIAHASSDIPENTVAIVLGTSPRSGKNLVTNPFFEGRMNAAASLYKEGRVYHLILSGDNRRADYNEPQSMKDALKQRGVPTSATTLDYAGFRTLDSMARAKRVFEIPHPLIITDDFHLPRALFLARAEGLEAIGFASDPVPWRRSYKTRIREWGSRIRAFLDVYFLNTQPRFLGKTISVPEPVSEKNPPKTEDPE